MAMALGPVEYIIVGFPENNFQGKIAPALAGLIESGTVRILDLVFVAKDVDGSVVTLEFDQLAKSEIEAFNALDADIGGVISERDIDHAASFLEPNSSAALVIWEDLWAAPFATAVREAGGVLLEGARVPYELVSAIEDALSA
jgi:translation initiation factor IF-2